MTKKLFLAVAVATGLAFSASPGWAQSKGGQQFLKKAMEGNLAEVQMGKLAQEKGASDGVRSFGKELEQDHSAAYDKAKTAAGQVGLTPPTEPNKKQKADYERMSKLSGAKFDRAFVTHMVADHKKDIKEYQKEANKNDAASGYAKESLPVLQKHLEAAQSLAAKTTTGSR
jgi:putative membrane protein